MGSCEAACSHGGVCILNDGHGGLHDASGYCHWADGEGMPREEADQMFADMMEAEGLPRDLAAFWAGL